ncbi:hypothetical protein [Acerihabitans arboris]|uniref:Uncharacterized protein n=1 Tax=Acerihabitans arboris TaxID=2691583 RepID=A0A845SQE8_9GAMM|nr:hypothetical protein [Acerihabitans arboris]NDL63375.1 hypothetical protein [Acerihabitans arboris]
MPSTELASVIDAWFARGDPQLDITVDAVPLSLLRRAGGFFCVTRLTLDRPVDDRVIQAALHLTGPALSRYPRAGALSLHDEIHCLCLIASLPRDNGRYALGLMETLVNQCEAWQDILRRVLKTRY